MLLINIYLLVWPKAEPIIRPLTNHFNPGHFIVRTYINHERKNSKYISSGTQNLKVLYPGRAVSHTICNLWYVIQYYSHWSIIPILNYPYPFAYVTRVLFIQPTMLLFCLSASFTLVGMFLSWSIYPMTQIYYSLLPIF